MSDRSGADIDRLRARLDRERRARRQAEVIAERGMRELWESNRELQARIARRIAEVERIGSALEYAHSARLRAIGDVVDDLAEVLAGSPGSPGVSAEDLVAQVRSLVAVETPAPAAPTDCGVVEIVDRIVDRWQRAAAKQAQLLSVEEGPSTVTAVCRWPDLLAATDTLIGGIVRVGGPGSLSVVVTAFEGWAELAIGGVCPDAVVDRGGRGAVPPELKAELLVASRIAAAAGGRIEIRPTPGTAALRVIVAQDDCARPAARQASPSDPDVDVLGPR